MKKVVVTADDFGIAEEINQGIIHAHTRGIVTSASLLVNAPATDSAISLAKATPTLEIGIHLSLVEGLSLRGCESTITDDLRYFGDGICLHRHWRQFLPKYLTGRIRLEEIEEELRFQIKKFKDHFSTIPFANTTQHLHLLPGIQELIIKLAKEFEIKALRIPGKDDVGGRFPFGYVLKMLGKKMRRNMLGDKYLNLFYTDNFAGFHVSGQLNESELLKIIKNLQNGTTEIMTHPGFHSKYLKDQLGWGYKNFRWEQETEALTSPMVRGVLRAHGVELSTFSNLNDEKHA